MSTQSQRDAQAEAIEMTQSANGSENQFIQRTNSLINITLITKWTWWIAFVLFQIGLIQNISAFMVDKLTVVTTNNGDVSIYGGKYRQTLQIMKRCMCYYITHMYMLILFLFLDIMIIMCLLFICCNFELCFRDKIAYKPTWHEWVVHGYTNDCNSRDGQVYCSLENRGRIWTVTQIISIYIGVSVLVGIWSMFFKKFGSIFPTNKIGLRSFLIGVSAMAILQLVALLSWSSDFPSTKVFQSLKNKHGSEPFANQNLSNNWGESWSISVACSVTCFMSASLVAVGEIFKCLAAKKSN